MKELVLGLVGWAGAHPHLAGLLVAAIACAESLAFVGLLVPGAIMMLGAGALIGVGALEFWSTFAWAVGGAIVGDGVSYWLGHRYQHHFIALRIVRERRELLARGETFFLRHGGKSILLARFVGPVRPVVPVVAGMLGMAPWRFYTYNVASALVWAPAHLVPGMAFGASLALAGQVAGRLAFGIALLLGFVWALLWAVRMSYRWLQPRAGRWTDIGLSWAQHHPSLNWLVGDLLDPGRPATRSLGVWLIVLLAGSWLFFGVLEDVLSVDPLVFAGQSFYQYLQQLRTPVGDVVMTALTELGDVRVALPVTVAVLSWFLWRRAWRDAWYWIAAVGFGAVAVVAIKYALHLPRPIALYAGADAFSFPSGHTTMNTVIYGYLAVLSAHTLAARRRWLVYAVAALLITGIGFSRLYLGAHWLADVAAGLGLGAAWVAVLAIARARHAVSDPVTRALPLVAAVVFVAAAAWHIHGSLGQDLARYAVHRTTQQMDFARWWQDDWRRIDSFRIDMEGEREQPLNVQWAGALPSLRTTLLAHGWHPPQPLTLRSAMNWLLPQPAIGALPVLPQLHQGRYDALVMIRAAGATDTAHQLILRLWPAATRLVGPDEPLWYGTVTMQRIEHLPLLRFSRNTDDYDAALAQMNDALTGVEKRMVRRTPATHEEAPPWSGKVLLLYLSSAGR